MSEVSDIAELVAQAPDGVEMVEMPRGTSANAFAAAVKDGFELESIKPLLDEYLDRPERRKGTAQHQTLESFAAHVNRFANTTSAIYASESPPRLLAVLDYHEPLQTDDKAKPNIEARPDWCQHLSVYNFPLSDEYAAWQALAGKDFNQGAFASLIEDRITEVLSPSMVGDGAKAIVDQIGCQLASPQQLMELSRGLSLRVDQRITNAVKLDTGEAQVMFEEKHDTKLGAAAVTVPGAFLIAVPIFRDGAVYQIVVRLRYRHRDGAISWSMHPYRLDRAFRHAFTEAAQNAAQRTLCPLFFGSPEV